VKKGRCTKNRTDPAPEAGWAGWPSPTGPGGSRRRLIPIFARIAPFRLPFSVIKFYGKFKKRKMRFLGFFSSDYLFGRIGSSGINPSSNILHPHSSHCVPEELRVEARSQGAIDGGGEVMRAQATRRDQEDRPHPLRRACPDRSYCISQPRRRREGSYAHSKVGAHLRHEEERLQGGVTRA
jgi:hypothetical protein